MKNSTLFLSRIQLVFFKNSTLLYQEFDFLFSRIRLCFLKNSTLFLQEFDFAVSRIRLCFFKDLTLFFKSINSTLFFQGFDFIVSQIRLCFFKNCSIFLLVCLSHHRVHYVYLFVYMQIFSCCNNPYISKYSIFGYLQ